MNPCSQRVCDSITLAASVHCNGMNLISTYWFPDFYNTLYNQLNGECWTVLTVQRLDWREWKPPMLLPLSQLTDININQPFPISFVWFDVKAIKTHFTLIQPWNLFVPVKAFNVTNNVILSWKSSWCKSFIRICWILELYIVLWGAKYRNITREDFICRQSQNPELKNSNEIT